MKKMFLLFFICIYFSHSVFSCDNSTQHFSYSQAQEQCKLGLVSLEKSVTPNQGYFTKEIHTEHIKTGVRHLLHALRQEKHEQPKSPTVAPTIIQFFKNDPLAQFLLMHGYVDELFNSMPHSGPADFDLITPIFNDTQPIALPAKKHLNINFLRKSSPFPWINRTNQTDTIETDTDKRTIHLSPDCRSFTCITKEKRSSKEVIGQYPLHADSFDSLCIGTKCYALVNKDETTNALHITLKSTKSFSDRETIITPYSSAIKIQLSPDEQKILCIDYASHYDKKHRVYDLNTKQWYKLDFSEFAAPHSLVKNLFDTLTHSEIGWSKDSDSIIARSLNLNTYSWKLPNYGDHSLIDNTTMLKVALYNHWLSSLKAQYLKEFSSESIHNLRRFMSVSLPPQVPVQYVTYKKQEWEAFMKEYKLTDIV
ncbi:MAG: hypothetical protein WCE21_01700 [Candidatus Babeliales bacterium]